MVSTPYRENAKVEKNMCVSQMARKIEEVYYKRLNSSNVAVCMKFRRYYTMPDGHGRYEYEYSARLMYEDRSLTLVTSKDGFEEALIELANQLEVAL